jgi:hypothetical protein
MPDLKFDTILTKEFLQKNFLIDCKSAYRIAEETGIPTTTIYRYLTKFGIDTQFHRKNKTLIGKKFGNLEVISRQTSIKTKNASSSTWKCKCDCGNLKIIRGSSLRGGKTKSCGCLIYKLKKVGYKEINGVFWKRIQISAKQRKILFDLKIEDVWDLFLKQNRRCAISGVEIKFCARYLTKSVNTILEQTASLDRIDSNGEYTLDNIQWVHKDVNYMKIDMTKEEFLNWCKIITNYNAKNNLPN